jgi:hypothetical protein
MKVIVPILLGLTILTGCHRLPSGTEVRSTGDLTVQIDPGSAWIHKMPVMPLIKIANRPQIAIWTETTDGRFLQTLYASDKTVHHTWAKAPLAKKPERPEALPVWLSRTHGAETISGATPKYGISVGNTLSDSVMVVFVEINHSTDYNTAYPRTKNDLNGQPSLIYRGVVDRHAVHGTVVLQAIGHGSPDGKNGVIEPDLQQFTTALHIVKQITAKW